MSALVAPPEYRKGAPDIDHAARGKWIADMVVAGHTQREIALALGVGVSAICQARRRHLGLEQKTRRPRKPTTRRPCMTCGKRFASEGPHNRMRRDCRRRGDPFSAR